MLYNIIIEGSSNLLTLDYGSRLRTTAVLWFAASGVPLGFQRQWDPLRSRPLCQLGFVCFVWTSVPCTYNSEKQRKWNVMCMANDIWVIVSIRVFIGLCHSPKYSFTGDSAMRSPDPQSTIHHCPSCLLHVSLLLKWPVCKPRLNMDPPDAPNIQPRTSFEFAPFRSQSAPVKWERPMSGQFVVGMREMIETLEGSWREISQMVVFTTNFTGATRSDHRFIAGRCQVWIVRCRSRDY